MRLSELRGKRVLTLDGKVMGRVHEVHCDGGKVEALMCGPASLIERWTGKTKGRRLSWADVVRIDSKQIIASSDGHKLKR